MRKDRIIRESVRKDLMETDIVHDNGISSTNQWKMIYRLMDNVKTKMDTDWQGCGGNISNQDVDQVIDYIYSSLKNITRNALMETDIVPDNGIVRNNFLNQWRMIYNLLANIKTSMDATYQDNGGRITKQHVDGIVEYINMSLDNILGK